MASIFNLKAIAIFLLAACTISSARAQGKVFAITKYGAKPNADVTTALKSAWREACASTTPSKIVVPKGTFILGFIKFDGPCKAPIELNVQGTLKAPSTLASFNGSDGWVVFGHIDHFTMSGNGVFDGQGHIAWAKNDCHKNTKCARLPYNIRFNFLTNSTIKDVTTKDSKNFHVNVLGCRNFTFHNFKISSPAESPNTDGIHIGRSTGVNVTDSTIETGDDCISIGDGSQYVNNPVIIDQEYCPWNQCNLKVPSKVRISNVSFKNIKGTTPNREAVKLICSKGIPCKNVQVGNIDLKYSGPGGPAVAVCKNLKPTILGKLFPSGCTA